MIFTISLLATSMLYINEPVVNMREHPTDESKVVSQAVFSEKVTLEKEDKDWSYVTTPDQYSGWILTKSFVAIEEPYDANLKVSRLAAHIYGVNDTEFGPVKTVPYGSKLRALDDMDQRWLKVALPDGKQCYIQKGDVALEPKLHSKEELVAFSEKFLGLPYTWGGRSSFGYDCSGFVQMLYSQIGIELQRDSKLQLEDSRFQTVSIEDLESGDLIFFGRSAEAISHVGMSIGNGKFIHSTVRELKPWIRISNLSDFEWSGHKDTNLIRIARQLIEKKS